MSKQKLELTWIGKDQQPQLEPRILIEDREKSFGDRNSQNMLIHGDNLLALKALEQEFSLGIKCIYIDPPFNTGQAFVHYDDNLEHSIWLSLMFNRINILFRLLDKNGLFWIHLDDMEVHYCKVFLDEIFGRSGFVSHITYERSAVAGLGQGGYLVNTTEHLLLYKKGTLPQRQNLGYYNLEMNTIKRYNRYVEDKGEKELVKEFNAKSNDEIVRLFKHKNFTIKSVSLKDFKLRENDIREFYAKNTDKLFRGNRVQKENSFQNNLIAEMEKSSLYSVEYIPSRGKNEGIPTILFYYNAELLSWLSDTSEIVDGAVVKSQKLTTLWDHEDIPKADIANEGGVYFPRGKKPEQLLKRIIEMSTEPGDWVLDSFLGSGTTAAVAHKMGRRWIGVELGDHCDTHCLPRLKTVITGEDQGGISKGLSWKGGGGFKYYYPAPSLLQKDKYNNWVIEKSYNPEMLAAAMAKHEGFHFKPDEHVFWKQGQSTEKDFIFTTTTFITVEYLDKIKEEMKPEETLMICCKAFQEACESRFTNINIKKIPQMLLGRCEFGKDDYSLNIVNVPLENEPAESVMNSQVNQIEKKSKTTIGKKDKKQDTFDPTLF